MTDPLMDLMKLNTDATVTALRRVNGVIERYDLRLTDGQMVALAQARTRALAQTGRVDLGEGILPKLAYAFADSPCIQRQEYADTLGALQDLFYAFKNECEDSLTDDELVEAMQTIFNRKAQGSLEYMENLTVADLYRALRPPAIGGEEEDDADEWID